MLPRWRQDLRWKTPTRIRRHWPRQEIQNTPGSLNEVLDALQADHAYLLKGGVFTQDVIDTWISYKRSREAEQVALRPHPYEFYMYYDI